MAQCITWKMAKLNPGSHQSAQASLQKKVWTKRQISAVPLRQSLLHCTVTTHTGRIVVSVWSVQYRLVKTAFVLLHFICSISSSLLQLVCPQLSPSCPAVSLGPDWLQAAKWSCAALSACTAAPAGAAREGVEAGHANHHQPSSGPEAVRGSWNWSKDSPGGGRTELAPNGQKRRAAAKREQGNCYGVTTGDKESTKARMGKRRGKNQLWPWKRIIY